MNAPFWLWLGEAVTVFCNGCFSGVGSGAFAGGGAAAATPTSDLSAISLNAVVAAALGIVGNGVRRLLIWQHSHEMPNPFVKVPKA